MFEKDLLAKFERIFGVKKTTYDAPNYEAPEQDCLFIEIAEARPRMMNVGTEGKKQTCIVSGSAIIFSQAARLPYGFFAKRLEKAVLADKKNLAFFSEIDVPNSPARMVNLHERRAPFTFLYDSQYDPAQGELTSMDTELTIEE